MLRTFIALNFPQEIITKAVKIIQYFKTQLPNGALKWSAIENLHLTIKFLGNIPENKLDQVKLILTDSTAGIPAFNIEVGGLGMYPNKHNPRAIWFGVTYDQALLDIHHNLDQSLQQVNVEHDKREFSPHLTIARVNQRIPQETRQEIGRTFAQFKVTALGQARIDRIILYQSELTPKGPIYTPLMSQPLNQV